MGRQPCERIEGRCPDPMPPLSCTPATTPPPPPGQLPICQPPAPDDTGCCRICTYGNPSCNCVTTYYQNCPLPPYPPNSPYTYEWKGRQPCNTACAEDPDEPPAMIPLKCTPEPET